MRPLPFLRVVVGDIFYDIDGTIFMKTGKCLAPSKEEPAQSYKELNCVILVPNKPKDARGQMRFKDDDVYCEVCSSQEVSELKLEHADDTPKSDL